MLLIYFKYDASNGNPKDKLIEFDDSREIFEAATDECIIPRNLLMMVPLVKN